MQKQHNYIDFSFSSRLNAFIEQIEKDYSRTRFYKKHWHIVDFIDDLEIFSINRLTQVIKECGVKTSRRTVSTFLFYLHLDNFLEFTPVLTLMGRVAQIYNLDTIDPEKKTKTIIYYQGINPQNHIKNGPKLPKQKGKTMQQLADEKPLYISSYVKRLAKEQSRKAKITPGYKPPKPLSPETRIAKDRLKMTESAKLKEEAKKKLRSK